MYPVNCYNQCGAVSFFDSIPLGWHYVCLECQPAMCKNDECYALAREVGGLCEGCDEIGFVRDGQFILFDDSDDADAGYDLSADAEALASAGFGTDEDYGGW